MRIILAVLAIAFFAFLAYLASPHSIANDNHVLLGFVVFEVEDPAMTVVQVDYGSLECVSRTELYIDVEIGVLDATADGEIATWVSLGKLGAVWIDANGDCMDQESEWHFTKTQKERDNVQFRIS